MNKKKYILVIVIVFLILIFIYVNSNYNKKNNSNKDNKSRVVETDNSIFSKYYSKALGIVKNMSDEEKVGQLFLVRYNKGDVEYLSNFYPGGYILFAKDFSNNTKSSMLEEIRNDQKINHYPLIMGVDEEGGFVTRVSRYKAYRDSRFLSPREYYDTGGYELLESTEREKAELLKSIGINLNLAPVADVSVNEDDYIYNRAFGYDADKTSEYVSNMVKYSKNNGINACLKHFPGYGNNVDTHEGIAIDNRSYDEISENDYKPFKAGIDAGVPCILVSHNIVNSIDSSLPASLSPLVYKELREKLGFSGVIITDDLAMKAVEKYVSEGDAAVMAINAGASMIITSDFLSMKNEVLESLKSGKIEESTINKAVVKVMEWKLDSGLFEGRDIDGDK